MNTAKVVSTGRVSIPESGREALQIITDKPWTVGGQIGPWTGIYVPPDTPPPATGDVVSWGTSVVWICGAMVRKLDYDFNPSEQPT